MTTSQGEMTSDSLLAMTRKTARERYPDMEVDGLDKVALLESVRRAGGWPAVLELGRAIRGLRLHPVVNALVAAGGPKSVIERWMLLEQFGHSRNRTELLSSAQEEETTVLEFRHVATDGGEIVAVNDLFVWGMLIGLLEASGAELLEAELVGEHAPTPLYGPAADRSAALPNVTHTLMLRCVGTAQAPVPSLPTGQTMARRVASLLERDLLRRWSLAQAADALGQSARSLQRALRAEGTSFTDVIHRARIEAAQNLLVDRRLALTEVAFCVGFADQAHFSRTFRRYCDVPPSAFRSILPGRS